jgi:hypothetical protein
MKTKKILACLLFTACSVSLLHSQSLVELAKKERERRAALKTRKAPVITNSDLLKVKLTPAVEVSGEVIPPGVDPVSGEEAVPPPPVTAAVGEEAESAAVEQVQEISDLGGLQLSEEEFRARLAELKTKVDDAQDLIDLLTLRMNALWQQFYNVDGARQEQLKAQIGQTYEKLSRTQLEASKALKEYDDFVANARRQGVPQIWIR